jgi:glycosyltransferase involved in cell wall biosynthesis
MINAKYPIDLSDQLINQAKELIKSLNLENDIELITDFLDDKECLDNLSKAKLVLFPYQETGESASGAVRYALAANRDILITPLDIFNDIKDLAFIIDGFTPEAIAEGIIKYFSNNTTKKDLIEKWLQTHRYSKLGRKLENIIKSVYINLDDRRDKR